MHVTVQLLLPVHFNLSSNNQDQLNKGTAQYSEVILHILYLLLYCTEIRINQIYKFESAVMIITLFKPENTSHNDESHEINTNNKLTLNIYIYIYINTVQYYIVNKNILTKRMF